MAGNAIRALAAYPQTSGWQTAYTAPSGTGSVVHTLSISTNHLSGTAGLFTVAVLFGPTSNYHMLLHPTAITANSRIVLSGGYPMRTFGWGVAVSASSASAVDVYIGGMQMT